MSTSSHFTRRRFPKPIVVALLFFVLIPCVALFEVWPVSTGLTSGLTLLFIGAFLGGTLGRQRGRTLNYNAAIFFFFALTASLVLSVINGSYSLDASWRWYLIALIVCLFTLLAASELKAIDPRRFHNVLSRCLWLGCFVYAALSVLKYYGLFFFFFSVGEPSKTQLAGLWGQPNLTTTACWLGLLSGAVSLPDRYRGLWWLSIIVFGWTLACAASRMSWLMTAGLLLLAVVSGLPRFRTSETRSSRQALMKGVTIVLFLLFLVPPVNQAIREVMVELNLLERDRSVSLIDRETFKDSARKTELTKIVSEVENFSLQEWVTGIGPGNYPKFSYQADLSIPPEGIVAGTWSHSHNLFTMLLVEFGLVGVSVAVVFVFFIAYLGLRSSIDLPRFFSIGALGLLFIHSNLEFPLWYLWFLILFCLLLTNLFDVREYRGESSWLKPALGLTGMAMIVALVINTGSQYSRVVQVAMDSDRDRSDFQALSILANDSLMGPFAILRKYRDFAPESSNIEWQLREVRRIKAWNPKDLVVLREFSLLVLGGDITSACKVAKEVAYRYPNSAPIMLDHILLVEGLPAADIAGLLNCIEAGLAGRGETILSMQKKNESLLLN